MHKYVQIMYTTNHTIHKYHIYTYKDHSFIHTDHSYIHTKVYLHAHAHTYIHTYIHTNITHSSIRDTHMHIIYIYTYGHGVFILTTSPKGKWHTIQNPLWNKDDIKMWLWTVSQPPCGQSLSPTGPRYQYHGHGHGHGVFILATSCKGSIRLAGLAEVLGERRFCEPL